MLDISVSVTRTSLWRDLKKGGKMVKGERNTRGTHTRFLVRSCNNLFIATFASRPTLEPQTEGFPSVSPTRGVLVFVLQCLSVL